ncbi:uncharacterized protein LOC132683621 [Panthera onca]
MELAPSWGSWVCLSGCAARRGTSGLLVRVELDEDRSCGRAGPSGTRGEAAARAARLGSRRGDRAGTLSSRRTRSDWEVWAPGSIIFLRGVGRWDGGWRGRGRGRRAEQQRRGPGGWVLEPRGAVARIPHLPRREWERGPRESRAELSARPRRGRGRGPAPAARPFPSRLPLPPKRSGAGPDPLAQEGCLADSASPRLLAAGCGPTAAGRRRTRRRAESGAAPPPFCPKAGGLLPGSTASRDRGLGLRCSRPRGVRPRAAAARGRSGEARGSRAQGAPCTPRALRRSGRSRRSSLLARLPPPPPPPESPPHPLLPPPPRPPRRSGLGSQRRAAASAPRRAAAPASAPRRHPQARPREALGAAGAPVPLPHLNFSPRPLPPWLLEPGPARCPYAGPGWRAVLPPTPAWVLAPLVQAPLFCIPF